MPDLDATLTRAAAALAEARSVAVLTGAGVSAESRIPTFREAAAALKQDADEHTDMRALWEEFDPATLATPEAFNANPELVSRWYDWRRLKCLAAEPNAGHVALAVIERAITDRGGAFCLATQNVDGLHARAGSVNIIELHGSILSWRCTRTGAVELLGREPMLRHPMESRDGGLLRPNVVWFGESLPPGAMESAAEAAASCDVFLTVGTSSVVYPAAGLTEIAHVSGATTIEVNPDSTPATAIVDHQLQGPSGELLPRLVALAFPG